MPIGGELAQQSADGRRVFGVKPAAGSSSASTAGRIASARAISTKALVDMGKRVRRLVERARIADKGEQAFGDRGGFRVALCRQRTNRAESPRRSAIKTLSMTDIVSNSWLV